MASCKAAVSVIHYQMTKSPLKEFSVPPDWCDFFKLKMRERERGECFLITEFLYVPTAASHQQFETLDMLFHFTLGHIKVQIILTMNKLVRQKKENFYAGTM